MCIIIEEALELFTVSLKFYWNLHSKNALYHKGRESVCAQGRGEINYNIM